MIDALYGAGASSPLVCQNDGVMVSVDNFSVTGNIVHALILVNGLCATTANQIANLQYELIRGFGRVLGLDWSQTNEEMFDTGEFSTGGMTGWPLMHPIERLCNGGSGQCFTNPTQLRSDDVAALNRLYPVTSANVASFPGKTITAAATISVRGTLQFSSGQGMQGVNVVLQPLVNGLPDLRYTVTAVSGVYFQGNAGNPVTGALDSAGNPLNRFGSDDPGLEGSFDLSGVPLPPGATSAQYQLTFEALNPLYLGSSSVGPYTTGEVSPSGTMPVIQLGTLSAGTAMTQNVAVEDADWAENGADGAEGSPATVPVTGEWTGRISGYAHSAWFQWWARGGRQFTIEAEALDENGTPTANKAQVVIGAWNGTDAPGTAPVTGTAQPFNGDVAGLTTLPVLTIADSEVRIGLADLRGDGRPDYGYLGRVLYADSVTPARLPPGGGPMVIQGMGFRPGMTVTVNGAAAPVNEVTPTTIVATAPASGGATGTAIVQVEDPQTLGIAAINTGVSYDAEPDDAISILAAPMGMVSIGVPQPFTVRAINVTSQTPAAGVTVAFALTQGAAALGCGQALCSVVTGDDGLARLLITPSSTAMAQVTASLTNASAVTAEFVGTTPPAIAALTPNLYVALGATAQWPVQALVLNGAGCGAGGADGLVDRRCGHHSCDRQGRQRRKRVGRKPAFCRPVFHERQRDGDRVSRRNDELHHIYSDTGPCGNRRFGGVERDIAVHRGGAGVCAGGVAGYGSIRASAGRGERDVCRIAFRLDRAVSDPGNMSAGTGSGAADRPGDFRHRRSGDFDASVRQWRGGAAAGDGRDGGCDADIRTGPTSVKRFTLGAPDELATGVALRECASRIVSGKFVLLRVLRFRLVRFLTPILRRRCPSRALAWSNWRAGTGLRCMCIPPDTSLNGSCFSRRGSGPFRIWCATR